MVVHKCNKEDIIGDLKINQAVIMEKFDSLLKNQNGFQQTMLDFIKEIKKNYATKEETMYIESKVNNHDSIIQKIGWAVVFGVLAFVGNVALTLFKQNS